MLCRYTTEEGLSIIVYKPGYAAGYIPPLTAK